MRRGAEERHQPGGAQGRGRAAGLWKVYGTGEAQVIALRGVDVEIRERAGSPRSWVRPVRGSRR